MMNTRCTKLSMVRDDSKSSKTSNKKCPVVLHGDHTPISWSLHERLNCSLISQSMWLHSPGSSHFMLTSIIEACKVDQDLTDIIFSEYKVALSRKRALVTQLDQSPLKDVSVIKKQCYLYDDYYLFVGSSFCSLLADCNFKDCLFRRLCLL